MAVSGPQIVERIAMKPRFALVIVVSLLAPFAWSQEGDLVAVRDRPEMSTVPAWKGTVRKTLERKGTFVPAEFDELRMQLKVYNGELKLTEVLAHGSFVNEGDVLARFDTEGIDRRLESDRMALDNAILGLAQFEEGLRLKAEQEAETLAKAETEAARDAKRLRGYREYEMKFDEENERLNVQGAEHRLEDQKDELDQLEKMYSEDELVDATEEIVLKRSRRNYARSKAYTDLNEQRRVYNKEWFYPWREEDLVREADNSAAALARLKQTQAMGKEKSEADLKQKRYDLERQKERFTDLQNDREKFVVRAPRRGILLHGAADAAPWPGRLEKFATVRADTVFLTVADPKKFKVATDIVEADLFKLKSGTAAEVIPTADPDVKLMGRMEMDYLPAKGNVFPATVLLGQTDLHLRPGLTCTVNVILEEERDAVLVPKTALIEKDEETFIRCAKGGTIEERKVVTGVCDGENVAIREGIAVGDVVVVPAQKKK